jgi:imidazolonepropionase-like amidohydrolase
MMGVGAEATLMRGFTTVRDAGGSPFGLKRAIDEGAIKGPRIYPSGLALSQTGGHADSRKIIEPNR